MGAVELWELVHEAGGGLTGTDDEDWRFNIWRGGGRDVDLRWWICEVDAMLLRRRVVAVGGSINVLFHCVEWTCL